MPQLALSLVSTRTFEHEELVVLRDQGTGLLAVVAIHSTVLGPAAGGLRLARYPTLGDAVADAMDLAYVMTLKNAAADLALGGGKAVLLDDGRWSDASVRSARLGAFAVRLEQLGGRYITAEDVGTTPADMARIAEFTSHVIGLPGRSGDPSAATARTVCAAIVAAVELTYGTALAGVRVGVLGAGHVGARVAARLRAAGAEVLVADLIPERAAAVALETGSEVVGPADFVARPMDVFAPCGMGGIVTAAGIGRLRCKVIAGAANNPLSDPALAGVLHRRGVLYVPDFLANAGGIIHVAAEKLGLGPVEVDRRIEEACRRTADVLGDALAADRSPLALALDIAQRRLGDARRQPTAALT